MSKLTELVPDQLDELCNCQLEDWIAEQHHLRAEIFYSMFHKKWSVNNYFVDTKKGKKVYPKDEIKGKFDSYDDAREAALIELFKLILPC
jgi:hypothetical protein